METKKTSVLFGVVVIAFLLVISILIKNFNVKRVNDFKAYAATLTKIVSLNNDRVRVLSDQLAAIERENEDLRGTLTNTRNDLDTLSKKLAQAYPVRAPNTAPVTVAATK